MPKLGRLRAIRERAALTQQELKEKSGVAASTISDLETGRSKARISTARRLAEALGVKPAELMSGPDRG